MLKKFTILLIVSGGLFFTCSSQKITNYSFAATNGLFTALSGGTSPLLSSGNADEGLFNNLPIGFDFWYNGKRCTTISASTNGWVSPGGTITGTAFTNNLTNGGNPRPVIAVLWDNLSLQTAANLTYLTTGVVGSRIFTIQYLNTKWNYTAGGTTISFQIKLYESTGKIEYIYRPESGNIKSGKASIGLSATLTGSGNFLSLNGTGTAPVVSSTTETTNLNNKPATGQTYSFTSPLPATPTALSFTNITGSAMTLNWTDNATNEIGYAVYRSNDGVSYTFISQTAANALSSIQNGLAGATTYHWRVFAVSEGRLSSALAGNQATLCTPPSISQIPQTNLLSNYTFSGNANDATGNNHGTLQAGPSISADRFNNTAKAYTFNGTTQYISTAAPYVNPSNFSTSIWFKTASTSGGYLIGFGNAATGSSSTSDRHIYMNNIGQLYFGVYPGSVVTVNSPLSYNDNSWHLATATLSSTAGMVLYVDGVQVGNNSATLTAQNYTGYWRIGYGNLAGWTSLPSSTYFNGLLDDALVYQRTLNAAEVLTLFRAPDGAGNNGPVCAGNTINLSATTVAGATYAWSGPNAFTSTLQNPTFSYSAANAGVYTLQVTAAACTATAYTTLKSTNTIGQWTGAVSTDWGDANNWCSGIIPTALIDVTIASTATRMPTISGTATCKNLTINSGATVTTSASGILNIAGNIANRGTMINSGTTNFIGTGAQQTFLGIATFYNLTLNNTNGLIIPSAVTVVNHLTLTAGVLNPNGFSLAIGGNWINNASTGAFAAGNSTIFFNGTGAQTIGGTFLTSFKDITSTNSLGSVSLNMNINITGDLLISAGIFDLGIFTANRLTTGGMLTVNNNATLKIGGTNTFPTNFATTTLVIASIVEYNGTNQTVANKPYGNLKVSSSAGAVVKTMPATATTILGKFTSTIGAGTSVVCNAAADIIIGDSTTIGTGTTLNSSTYTINAGGSWKNSGTFNGNTGTVIFTGAGASVSGTGLQNFNNLTVSAPSVTFSNASITLSGNLLTSSTGSFSQASGGILTMTGTGSTISGSGISIDNLAVNGTVSTTASFLLTGNLSVSGTFTGTAGFVTMTGNTKTISGAGSVSFAGLVVSGAVTSSASFVIGSSLVVYGTFSATTGTATFTGSSILSGTANLFNATINGISLQLSAASVLGIANTLSITSGTLNVTSSTPNTVNFNATGAQNINAITYYNLNLSNGNIKTAGAAVTVNGTLTVATATTFAAGSFTHSVYGDWINSGTFTAGAGTIQFLGGQTENITGATNFNILTVNHMDATTGLVLQSNITVATLNMTTGNLLTGNNSVNITTTRTGPGIILGNIQRTHTFTTGVNYEFEGPDNFVNFMVVTGITSITMSVTKGTISDFPFGGSISRLYNISVPVGTYAGTLRLHYEDDELNGNVENTMTQWNYNGSSWNSVGKSANSTASNYVELTALSNITNHWTISDNINAVRWNGSVSSDWANPANWTALQGSATRPPSATDIVNIGDTLFVNQPIITSTVNVKSLRLSSTKAVNLILNSGGSLSTGDINGTWSSNAIHNIFTNNQPLNINGNLTLSDGVTGHVINLSIGTGTVSVTGSITQNAAAEIVFGGAGNLTIGADYNYINGLFVSSTGTVFYNGAGNQIVAPVSYNNLSVNKTGGLASIKSFTTISGNLAVIGGELDNQSTTTIAANVTISAGAIMSNTATLKVGGNWLNLGSYVGNGVNLIFNGAGTQTISSSTFNNLEFNKPVGSAAQLTGPVTLKGNLMGTSGTLDIGNYFFNRDVRGGSATMTDSATLIIGLNNAPNNFASYALTTGSTIIFNGTDTQHLALPGLVYGNLIFRNAGNKILYTPITVMGKLTIESAARFDAGANTITINGDWVNNGIFIPQTSTVVCGGTSKFITGITTFNKFTATGTYTFLNNLTFNGLLSITNTGGVTVGSAVLTTLNGDLLNSGVLNNLGTTTFTGLSVQTLSLINAIQTTALTVNFNGNVSPVLNSTSAPQFGFLNINNTAGVSPSVGWTVLHGMTVGTGASFYGGISSHTINGSFTNNGTVTSNGTISFIPSSAKTINLGTNFSSTGRVYFGGTGALSLLGSPTSFAAVNINNTNAAGITPSSNWNMTGTLRIISGCTFFAGNYNYNVGGNLLFNGTYNAGTSTIVLNGSSKQEITSLSSLNNLTINKTNDSTVLLTDLSLNGTLNFISGKVYTSAFKVIIPHSGNVTGASQNTGWIYGNLQKRIVTGAITKTFEIGDYSNYTPVAIEFDNVTAQGSLTASTIGTEHPNISSSNINASKSLNRYWILSNSGIAFTTFAATFNYLSADVDAGAVPTSFDLESNNGSSWITPVTTLRNATNIKATGLTAFGDYAAGDICNKGTTISYFGTPYCTSAGTAEVTLTGTTGGVFSADPGLSINVVTGAITLATSTPGSYIVTYTIAATGSCAQFITNATAVIGIAGTWTGAINNEWNNPGNWACGGIPTSAGNVTIPTGLTTYPTITGIVAVNDITIQNSSAIIVTGKLQIAGAVNNAGTFTATAGTIEMVGTAAQTIAASAFENYAVNNLIISNTSVAGVSLSGALEIFGSLTYSGIGKTFVTNDFLTLKSTATNTAWIGDMTGNTITGKVTVERFISARKAWRYLSVPTNTIQTFKDTWQEAAVAAADNLSSGYGIQITSNRPSWAIDGFDNSSASPSLKTYDPITNSFIGVTATNNAMNSADGYMTFIRGDRTVIATSSAPTQTILRTTGNLYTGDQPAITVLADNFKGVGNPFASSIDVRNITKAGVRDFFYLWDPNMGGVLSFGGYQVLSKDVSNNYVVTPGGGSFGTPGSINNMIQSGLAFFVQGAASGGSITLKEAAKASGSSLTSSAQSTAANPANLRLTLNGINADNSTYIADGVFMGFDDTFSNAIDDLDAAKSGNTGENLAVKRDGKLLIIERRFSVAPFDTIFLDFTNAKFQQYNFTLNTVSLSQPGMFGYLEDAYLNISTPLNLDGLTTINFLVENTLGSNAADRFKIVFKPATVLPLAFIDVNAVKQNSQIAVIWKTANEVNLQHYEVEKSTDAVLFTKIHSTPARNAASNTYNWTDVNPAENYNYYRIKSIDINGQKVFSKLVKVLMGDKPIMTVKPNPITNNIINLQMTGIKTGLYNIRLLNTNGQVIYSTQIKHLANTANEQINLNNQIAEGLYRLEIITAEGTRTIISVTILK